MKKKQLERELEILKRKIGYSESNIDSLREKIKDQSNTIRNLNNKNEMLKKYFNLEEEEYAELEGGETTIVTPFGNINIVTPFGNINKETRAVKKTKLVKKKDNSKSKNKSVKK